MRARKQEPTIVTWNSLLSCYAASQDLPGVVKTLKSIEDARSDGTSYTMKALGRMTDRNALLDALDRNTRQQEVEHV